MTNPVYILLLVCFCSLAASKGLNQKLLVISFDGFRDSYMNSTLLPWFNYFGEVGVISHNVRSIFPSDTFPNHWAIATGMYAESHGIIANSFFDPALNKTFSMQSLEVYWWDQAWPIWRSARKQGHKKVSVSFWPGSAVLFDDGEGTPNYYRAKYDDRVPPEERIDETVDYLSKKDVDLALLYFNEPDKSGHSAGPGSKLVNQQLQLMDWYLSYILLSLNKAGLGDDRLNVIVCADHGMINVTTRLWIGNYIDMKSVGPIDAQGAMMTLRPKPGMTEEIMANLSRGSEESGGLFKAYLRKDVPAEFHYSNNARITDIVIICKLAVYMSRSAKSQGTASHGFDPKDAPMQPVFMARGPAFKTGGYLAKNVFETKDIYAMMAHITGITPAAEANSTLETSRDIFRIDPISGKGSANFATPWSSILALLLVAMRSM